MGVQHGCHHPPRREDTNGKVVEAKLSLNWTGPYKILAVGPCTSANTPGGSPLCAKLFGSTLRHARRGCSPARFGTTLQALCQTPRPWRHAEVFASGVDAIRAQQFLQEVPPVPRHSRRRFDSSSTTRSGVDHRTPIGSRSRWDHRGYVQDALDGCFWTALGAGNGRSSALLFFIMKTRGRLHGSFHCLHGSFHHFHRSFRHFHGSVWKR